MRFCKTCKCGNHQNPWNERRSKKYWRVCEI